MASAVTRDVVSKVLLRVSHLKPLVCLFVCLFVRVSSYLHCEWATEQQLVKDKRIQQKIKRFKMKQAQRALLFADVRLCGCVFVCGRAVCRHYVYTRHIWLFGMSRCACLTGNVCVCVCFVHLPRCCVRGCLIDSLCFVCVGRHICVHSFELNFYEFF